MATQTEEDYWQEIEKAVKALGYAFQNREPTEVIALAEVIQSYAEDLQDMCDDYSGLVS